MALFRLDALARVAGRLPVRNPFYFWLLLYVPAVAFFALNRTLGPTLGWLQLPAEMLGSITCGLSWLFTRLLFRPASNRESWPWYLIGVQFLTSAILVSAEPIASPLAGFGVVLSAVTNLNMLIGSTALVLTLFEPLSGFGQISTQAERHFRGAYLTGYILLVTVAVLLERAYGPDTVAVKVGCALASLFVSGAALWFRATHPLAETPRKRMATDVPPDVDRLRTRILAIIEDRELYRNPDLKVADIARQLGEPAYRLSQCTNGLRGFQNFNQLINAYRIDSALRALADPASNDLSILAIAMDCGFASIGPFNRAFKERTGMTPTQFRQAHTPGDRPLQAGTS